MLDAVARINWIAVVIAIVASAALGGAYYFGALVGTQYLRALAPYFLATSPATSLLLVLV